MSRKREFLSFMVLNPLKMALLLEVSITQGFYKTLPNYLQKYNTKNGIGGFIIEIKILKVNRLPERLCKN